MIRQSFFVPKLDWEVTVFYNADERSADEVLDAIERMGCGDDTYFSARKMLMSDCENSGFTYSNLHDRQTVITITRATSQKEFANTWFHEVMHCAVHIATAIRIDYQGEDIAYIGGFIAGEMQKVAGHIMCPDCA